VEFEKKLCLKFEKALNQSKKKVKVDKERFVDLQNMLQRRYDDPMKRRSLKVSSILLDVDGNKRERERERAKKPF